MRGAGLKLKAANLPLLLMVNLFPLDSANLWIVDPICGSLNYVQGIPYFGVSIALRAQGAIRVSLGIGTVSADIERFIDAWSELIKRMQQRQEAA